MIAHIGGTRRGRQLATTVLFGMLNVVSDRGAH